MNVPCIGYGIRYEYGIFRQTFVDGWQVEQPDNWLALGNPWEFPHPETAVTVDFGGHTEKYDDDGVDAHPLGAGLDVLGVPYNYMVPGFENGRVNTLRLWSARATRAFNLEIFNAGDYAQAVRAQTFAENISKVLYPEDSTPQGKELRLQQQYFFVACSLRDFLDQVLPSDFDLRQLPERIIFQLNDTHPVIAIPELMRILVDERGLEWDEAWAITQKCFAYTCHTLLPEALEVWPVELLGQAAAAAPRDHLPDQRGVPGRAARGLPGRRAARAAHVDHRRVPRARGPDGLPGDGRRLEGQRRRRPALAAAAGQGPARLLRPLPGQVHQRHQRRHPAPVPAAGQPGPVGADHRRDRRRLGHRPRPAQGARAVRRRRRLPGGVPPGQAREQAPAGRRAGRARRHRGRPRHDARRHGQAAARVQAADPQAAARRHAVRPDDVGRRADRGRHAADVRVRRQGGAGLPDGQADHRPDQRGRPRRSTTTRRSRAGSRVRSPPTTTSRSPRSSSPRPTCRSRSRWPARRRRARAT